MSTKFSIIIPCYNEEKGLNSLINAIKNYKSSHDVEFILVENGSLDKSRDIFELRKEFDNVYIKKVYVDVNKGYGYGIKEGLKIAEGDFVGWMHADLQIPVEDLEQFFDYAEGKENKHILMKGNRSGRPFLDSFFTFGMGLFETLLFKNNMYDVMSMPNIFHKDLLNCINIFPDDFSIDIFIYAKALKEGYEVYRKPIHLKNREFGDSSWNTGIVSRIKQSRKMIDGSIRIKELLK